MPHPTPPQADRKPHTLTLHGHTRQDEYYWLRQRDDPAVIAHLEGENSYAEAMLAHTVPLQEQLFSEMVSRIQETDATVPEQIDDFFYYSRTEQGKQYPIYCRKQGSLEAAEQVLLDLNELAEGQAYLELGVFKVSPDHRLLAYSLDRSGAEEYLIYVKVLESGAHLPDQIPNTAYAAEWANDSQTLFYTSRDPARRADKAWRHRLGSPVEADELLFHEPDERFSVDLGKTKDRAYLLLLSQSIETSEVYTLDAGTPAGHFQLVQPRRPGVRYSLEHRQGTAYILTNDEAANFRVMTAPMATPGREQWQERVAHRQPVKIDAIDLFARHLVLYQRQNGLRTIQVINLESDQAHELTFPEAVYTYTQWDNPDFHSGWLRFTYSSLTTADSVFDYNLDDRSRVLRKQQAVPGGYDPAAYQSERLMATAGDGVQVPISLVYRKGLQRDGSAPCLLYGYGSYGFSLDPAFNSNRLSLMDRGVVFALAHVRGGQTMGRAWYDQGKFLHKRNSFTDFIACARHLIAQRFTSPAKLAIMGRSAGGLLMGAVLNMAPGLFAAAVAGVPFVDVVTTMLDDSIPLTVGEYEEWGNPHDRRFYDYMLSYSPYDNVAAQPYPHLLVTAGLNDPRVQYWEPAKWTARLRARKTDDHWLLLKTNMGAGHRGASGRYESLKELALYYAFILDRLGVTTPAEPSR